MKWRARWSAKPSRVAPSNASASRSTTFFIVSVATTMLLSPSV